MLRFAVRRLLLLVPILLGLSVLVFLFVRALPGGPEQALLGERATPARIAEVRQTYGLDKPLPEQYARYMEKVATGDLGTSAVTQRDVADEIKRRFPGTIELTITAILFAVLVGIPLGYLSARRAGTWVDSTTTVGSLLGIAVPVFALGYLLKYVFAVKLGWLEGNGRESATSTADHPTNFYVLDGLVTGNLGASWDAVKHLIMPGLALGTIPLALVTRITRASVLEVTNEDYVRTAEAKGLQRGVISRRHVLRNALLPVVTVIGLQTGLLLSGAVLTETVFSFNGMGSFVAQGIFQRDYPVVQGGILLFALVFVLVNLLVDLAYGLIDPRIRTR